MKRWKSVLLVCLLSCWSALLFAQTVRVQGRIVDEQQQPLSFANVTLTNSENAELLGFAYTNEQGIYELTTTTTPPTTCLLTVTFLGYETLIDTLAFTSTNKISYDRDFTLVASTNQLKTVEVQAERMAMLAKEDTLQYDIKQFTNGTEEVLEDVLDKLPGIEVAANGDVYAKGKRIDKVMLDGESFFGAHTKLSTKNLNADFIDQIQVIDEASSNGLGEETVLNIATKQDQKNKLSGSAEVGGGLVDRYQLANNLLWLRPNLQVALIQNWNNIGREVFTIEDYIRFSGGIEQLSGGSTGSIRINTDNLGLPVSFSPFPEERTTRLNALHLNYRPNKRLLLNAYVINNEATIEQQQLLDQLFPLQDGVFQITEQNDLAQKIGLNNANLRLEYAFTPSLQLNLQTTYRDTRQQQSTDVQWLSEVDDSRLFQQDNSDQRIFEQQIELQKQFDNKSRLSLSSRFAKGNRAQAYQLTADTTYFANSFVFSNDTDSFTVFQHQQANSSQLATHLSYHFQPISKHLFSLSTGQRSWRNEDRDDVLQQLTNNQEAINRGRFSVQQQEYYMSFQHQYENQKFLYQGSLEINQNRLFVHQQSDRQLWTLRPSIFLKYKFNRSHYLQFNYQLQPQFPGIHDLKSYPIIQNYRTVLTGNEAVSRALENSYQLNYVWINLFAQTTLVSLLNVNRRQDAFGSAVAIGNQTNQLQTINIPLEQSTLFYTTFQKSFTDLSFMLELKAKLLHQQAENRIKDLPNPFTQLQQDYTISINSIGEKLFNYTFAYTPSVRSFQSDLSKTRATTLLHTFQTNVQCRFGKTITFRPRIEYVRHYENGDFQRAYPILGVHVSYRPVDSPFRIQLSGNNLLDETQFIRQVNRDFFVEQGAYQILGRVLVIKVKYDF